MNYLTILKNDVKQMKQQLQTAYDRSTYRFREEGCFAVDRCHLLGLVPLYYDYEMLIGRMDLTLLEMIIRYESEQNGDVLLGDMLHVMSEQRAMIKNRAPHIELMKLLHNSDTDITKFHQLLELRTLHDLVVSCVSMDATIDYINRKLEKWKAETERAKNYYN